MRKHYRLDHPIRQSNNFVVFPPFFRNVYAFMVPRTRRSRTPASQTSTTSADQSAKGSSGYASQNTASSSSASNRSASTSRLTPNIREKRETSLLSSSNNIRPNRPSFTTTQILPLAPEPPGVKRPQTLLKPQPDLYAPRLCASNQYTKRTEYAS